MTNYTVKQAPQALDRKLRKRIDYVMRQIGMEADHVAKAESPVWSGAYVASWNLKRGVIDRKAYDAPEPWGEDTKFEIAGPAPPDITPLRQYFSDLRAVYLTNSARHAAIVERSIAPVRDMAKTYAAQIAPTAIRKSRAIK